jgi:transcriptional regulator GlxA family with amidase domain
MVLEAVMKAGEKDLTDPRIVDVLDLIEMELSKDLSVSVLAHGARLSASRLAHIFKRDVGVPIEAYVKSRRIARARDLLITTSLTIKEIAGEAGFVNTRHFARVFKRYSGHSPVSYRIQEQQK